MAQVSFNKITSVVASRIGRVLTGDIHTRNPKTQRVLFSRVIAPVLAGEITLSPVKNLAVDIFTKARRTRFFILVADEICYRFNREAMSFGSFSGSKKREFVEAAKFINRLEHVEDFLCGDDDLDVDRNLMAVLQHEKEPPESQDKKITLHEQAILDFNSVTAKRRRMLLADFSLIGDRLDKTVNALAVAEKKAEALLLTERYFDLVLKTGRRTLIIKAAKGFASLGDKDRAIAIIQSYGTKEATMKRFFDFIEIAKVAVNCKKTETAIAITEAGLPFFISSRPSGCFPYVIGKIAYLGNIKKALEYASLIRNHGEIAYLFSEISGAYVLQGETEKAKEIIERAYKAAMKLHNIDSVVRVLISIAGHYFNMGDENKAKEIIGDCIRRIILEDPSTCWKIDLFSRVGEGAVDFGMNDISFAVAEAAFASAKYFEDLLNVAKLSEKLGVFDVAYRSLEVGYNLLIANPREDGFFKMTRYLKIAKGLIQIDPQIASERRIQLVRLKAEEEFILDLNSPSEEIRQCAIKGYQDIRTQDPRIKGPLAKMVFETHSWKDALNILTNVGRDFVDSALFEFLKVRSDIVSDGRLFQLRSDSSVRWLPNTYPELEKIKEGRLERAKSDVSAYERVFHNDYFTFAEQDSIYCCWGEKRDLSEQEAMAHSAAEYYLKERARDMLFNENLCLHEEPTSLAVLEMVLRNPWALEFLGSLTLEKLDEEKISAIARFLGLNDDQEEKFLKVYREEREAKGEAFTTLFNMSRAFSSSARIAFPRAFETIYDLMQISEKAKLKVPGLIDQAIKAIPEKKDLAHITAKYRAIPLDVICFAICYVNGMSFDSILSNFNTVFSAKNIKDSRNNKLSIRNALVKIYLSESKLNIAAVIDLLLLVENGFGKSDQKAFVEALRYIESLGVFGDLIATVEETVSQG